LAEDLAVGCYLIAKTKAEGIFNISGSDLLTPYEMAIQTAQYFGLDQNLIHKADASTFTQDAKRPLRTGFILEKATRVLGYTPRSFKEGIAYLANQMAVS
jgi:dTDP-4-dehydrorhamnose reductase